MTIHTIDELDDPEATADLFWSRVRGEPGVCWPWPLSGDGKGYGRTFVRAHGRRTRILTHQLAYILATGSRPALPLMVRHLCGNRACCNPADLTVGTYRDNAADRDAHGRTAKGERHAFRQRPDLIKRGPAHYMWGQGELQRGEKNSHAALTEAQVVQMHEMLAQGISRKSIAASMGTSYMNVKQILNGRTWKHVYARFHGSST